MTTPKGVLGRRPPLDGLRGLAVLAVLLCHLHLRTGSGGMVGVDVFFVLSGFLITQLLLEEHARSGRVELWAFFRRRALRLLPALALLLAVADTGASLGQGLLKEDVLRGAPFVAFYSGNWRIIAGHSLGPLGHTWSLAVEEQFYLVWPLVMWCCLRRRAAKRLLPILVLIGLAASALTRLNACSSGRSCVYRVYHGTDTRAGQLLIGCGLALLFRAGVVRELRGRWPAALGWSALAVLAVIAGSNLGWANHAYDTVGMDATAALAAAIVASVLMSPRSSVARFLESAPLRRLGLVSYGLYLWQGWVLVILSVQYPRLTAGPRALIALPLVAALTLVSYTLVERPALRWGRSRWGVAHAPVAVASQITGLQGACAP